MKMSAQGFKKGSRWRHVDKETTPRERSIRATAAVVFLGSLLLAVAAADAGVFCPTQCKIKTVPVDNKIWFFIDMPESVQMDLYVGKNIDAAGNILSPTAFNGGHEGVDWSVAVQGVELDTLYYYRLKVTNEGGGTSSKYGAVWSNQVNLRLVWSHLEVIENGEDLYSGAGELSLHVLKDNKNGEALFTFGNYSSWAVNGHTYNVNKQKVLQDIKGDHVKLFAWASESDIGSATPGSSYAETTYTLPLDGVGWSNKKREFSVRIYNTQYNLDLKLHFIAQLAYAITKEKPVPNMSHLDSKFPVLKQAGASPALRRITVQSPNGGELWNVGSTKTITWTSVGVGGNVKVILRKADKFFKTISPSAPNSATIMWNIPLDIPPGNDYRIRVKNMGNTINDDSDTNFSIAGLMQNPQKLSKIVVQTPNGGETWIAGQTKAVTWSSLGMTGNVMVVLRKADKFYKTISPSAPSSGTIMWTIPGDIPSGSDYKIRVRNMDNSINDDSNGSFTISQITLHPGMMHRK